jgi:hypothetical protein
LTLSTCTVFLARPYILRARDANAYFTPFYQPTQRHQVNLVTCNERAIDDLCSVADDSAMITALCDLKKTKTRRDRWIPHCPLVWRHCPRLTASCSQKRSDEKTSSSSHQTGEVYDFWTGSLASNRLDSPSLLHVDLVAYEQICTAFRPSDYWLTL